MTIEQIVYECLYRKKVDPSVPIDRIVDTACRYLYCDDREFVRMLIKERFPDIA